MAKYTISTHIGSVYSAQHNYNKEFRDKEDHIDSEREIKILEYTNIRDKYKEVFGAAVEEYNSKQKQKSRRIESYYDKIKNDKMKKNCYEMIVQIGNYENKPDEELQEEILTKFYEEFKEKYPNMKIVGCVIHNDESSPHMHLDFIPIKHSNKGLKVSLSMSGACDEMGFKNPENKYFESGLIQWTRDVNKTLESICNSYGLEIVHPERDKKEEQKAIHTSIKEYRDTKIKEEIETNRATLEEQESTMDMNKAIMISQDEQINKSKEEISNLDNKIIDIKTRGVNLTNEYNKVVNEYNKANDKLKNLVDEYNNRVHKYNDNFNQIRQLINEQQEEYNKAKKENEDMCLNVQKAKEEFKKIVEMPTNSILNSFLNKGKKDMLGNKKYDKQEQEELQQELQNASKKLNNIDSIIQDYKNEIRDLEKQINRKNNEIQFYKDGNKKLKEDYKELLFYESFVKDGGAKIVNVEDGQAKIIDFQQYKNTKKIDTKWGSDEFGQIGPQNKIVVVDKEENNTKEKAINKNKNKDNNRGISF